MSISAQFDQSPVENAFAWCEKCGEKVRLEFHTINGRLYQAPLRCGHKYDPEAVSPTSRKPTRPMCVDCDAELDTRRTNRCKSCRELRRAEHDREKAARRKHERSGGKTCADCPEPIEGIRTRCPDCAKQRQRDKQAQWYRENRTRILAEEKKKRAEARR